LSFELNSDEGKFLVELARNAVKEYLKTRKHILPPENTHRKMFKECGVFVTINKLAHGEKQLRGCIGYPYPTAPLVEAVIDSAINAATQDPRFPSLSTKELDGEHGLIVERGGFKGLLLPQVPVEWNWCEEEFLCQCCMKAGLTPDTWLAKGTKIYKFKGIIFEEETPQGVVKRKALKEK
jgi:AMMECR1 domain-containing protein